MCCVCVSRSQSNRFFSADFYFQHQYFVDRVIDRKRLSDIAERKENIEKFVVFCFVVVEIGMWYVNWIE